MNTFYYVVESIDGDYAHLRRTDENWNVMADTELKLVARALLPMEISEGCHVKNEMLMYHIVE